MLLQQVGFGRDLHLLVFVWKGKCYEAIVWRDLCAGVGEDQSNRLDPVMLQCKESDLTLRTITQFSV